MIRPPLLAGLLVAAGGAGIAWWLTRPSSRSSSSTPDDHTDNGGAMPHGTIPAGRAWVQQFPTSRDLEDLAEPFRTRAKAFIGALRSAGATVLIAATLRPAERAWLMHWSWMISREGFDPAKVPPHPGIDILWTKAGADEMCEAYGLAFRPALDSRHIQGNAVDMNIVIANPITIDGPEGRVTIAAGDGDVDPQLFALGATFGVHKLVNDHPHWSNDGH